MSESADHPGGSGGPAAPGIRTTRLLARALREHWSIPTDLRPALIERLAAIVRDPAASPREITSAAKAILNASRLNLDGIAATIKAEEHEDLIARVSELERRMSAREEMQ
jgi:hypothetical protein